MKIFTLLGIVVDKIAQLGGVPRTKDTVYFDIDDTDIIGKYVLPLCDDETENHYQVIENGEWYKATLVFARNDRNTRGELSSIIFFNSEGDEATCKVGEGICAELASDCTDELYYQICDKILE